MYAVVAAILGFWAAELLRLTATRGTLPSPLQVLEEAHNAQKLRQMAPSVRLKEQGYGEQKQELLTVEDLQKALEEVGSSSQDGMGGGGSYAASGVRLRLSVQ